MLACAWSVFVVKYGGFFLYHGYKKILLILLIRDYECGCGKLPANK